MKNSISTSVLNLFNVVYATSQSKAVDAVELQKLATKVGYIITPQACYDFVQNFLNSKNVDTNSTFYKSWSQIITKDRFELFLDQIQHYASTYGTFFEGSVFTQNDGNHDNLVIDFTKYKVLISISKKDLVKRVEGMLYANVALSQETLDIVFEIAIELGIVFDVDKIKNKELFCKVCDTFNLLPTNNDDFVRYLVYKFTGKTLVIKSNKLITEIKTKTIVEVSSLIKEYGIEKLSSSFNRYKDLLLAMKSGNASVMNKLAKLSKTNHVPMSMPFWNIALTDTISFKQFSSKVDELTSFKIIQLIQSIDKDLLNLSTKAYNIRNGKVWVDVDFKFTKSTELLNLKREVLYSKLVEILKDKYSTVKDKTFTMPVGLEVVCPTSEKNFIGNYPIGTSFDFAQDNNIVGIFWESKNGGSDFDLSIEDSNGNRLGWNASYNQKDEIVFSGDMTSANPCATELFYFKGKVDVIDYLVKVNAYRCGTNSKYKLLIAQEQTTNFGLNYMVNPSNIKFEVDLISEDKQSTVGFISDGKYYLMNLSSGNSRVSSNGQVSQAHLKYLYDTKTCFLNLKNLLIAAGFTEIEDSKLNFDFKEISKDTILNLFS